MTKAKNTTNESVSPSTEKPLDVAKRYSDTAHELFEKVSGLQMRVEQTVQDTRRLSEVVRSRESEEQEKQRAIEEENRKQRELAEKEQAEKQRLLLEKQEADKKALEDAAKKNEEAIKAQEADLKPAIPASEPDSETTAPTKIVTAPEKAEEVRVPAQQKPQPEIKEQGRPAPVRSDRTEQKGETVTPRKPDKTYAGYSQRPDRPEQRSSAGYAPRTQQRAPGQGGSYGTGYAPKTTGYAPKTPGYNSADKSGGYKRPGFDGQQRPAGDRPSSYNNGQQRTPRPSGTGTGRYTPSAPASGSKDRVSNYDPNKSNYNRTREAEKHAKNKKAMMKEAIPGINLTEEEMETHRKIKRGMQQQQLHHPEPVVIEHAIITTETISVKNLSEKIGKPVSEIIKKLFGLGILANINQEIDFDTCEVIAADYGITLELQIAKSFEEVLTESADDTEDKEAMRVTRPPIVTIMGHVDHGKTSLLDAIRHSNVTGDEAGGITQHIGAYTVTCNNKPITFIDTPGHEAFTSMRARGAQVTDIVILVVAADDGIMPQTIEAINHSKAAGVPIIVAINKIDRENAEPERIKQQLTEYGLVVEDWGGDTICVSISAKQKIGIDNLLEMVLLESEVLELKANPDRLARGTIIEAELNKGRGPIATVLVQNGTLKVGDTIVAGTAYGRVRAMMDDKGRRVEAAGPSCPVQVLGFSEVPAAGDILNVAEIDKLSRQVAEERRDKQKAEQLKNLSKISLDDLYSQISEGEIKDLNIIIKADVQGSVEAVKQALEKLSNDEIHVKCIHCGVGAITGTDIVFASASNAIVIGFNVRPDASAKAAAEREKVDVRLYRIIYNAIEDVQKAMLGMFAPQFKEVELGHISVRNTFKVSGVGTIAGGYVQDGKVARNASVRVVRDGIVIHEGKISSLKRFKDDAKEVLSGYECGIGIENFNDIEEGDTIEAFAMEEVKRTTL